jgi:hypothetical protein
LTLAAQESPPASDGAKHRLTVVSSWFANSHADASFMPQGIEGMVVTPDGTTYTNIRWEEGGGNVTVVTADGTVQPRPHMPGYHGWGHSGGQAVAANSKYVFFSQNYNNEGGGLKDPDNWPPSGKDWYGISRRLRADIGKGPAFVGGKGGKDCPSGCFLPVHEVANSTVQETVHIRSLCANEEELFVSCPFDRKIRVYDAEQMTLKRSWDVADPGLITLDHQGALWVAIGPEPTVLKRYDAQGKALPQSITVPEGSRVGCFCVDRTGRMLIGDVGPNECVLIYQDIATQPKQAGTFGVKQGLYSGTPGALGPLKFHQVRGIGVDATGALYIANTQHRTIGPGVWLEKYSPTGTLQWRRHGVVFTDSGAVDPASDGRTIYGMTERYDVDLGKPPGQEATLAAFTANFYKYPHDPRFVQYDNSGVYIRKLENRTFVVTTGMGSGQSPFCIYRLSPATDGEVLIPCVVWSNSPKYPHAPEGHWMWRDANGNGQFDKDEYTKTNVHDAYGGNSAFMDTRGDIWMTCWGPLRKIAFRGVDRNGVPVYDGTFTVVEAPKPLSSVRRVRYDPDTDVMVLGGTMEGEKTHHWKSMGNHLCRYDGWSTGKRTATWHVTCTFQKGSPCEPISFDVAGDHAFLAVAERGKIGDQEIRRGHIDVYELKTGASVGYIEPPENWGVGWMDACECLSVYRQKNGEYLIIEEEDGRSKNLLYRWNPSASTGPR